MLELVHSLLFNDEESAGAARGVILIKTTGRHGGTKSEPRGKMGR
jgi:hypothetical protein